MHASFSHALVKLAARPLAVVFQFRLNPQNLLLGLLQLAVEILSLCPPRVSTVEGNRLLGARFDGCFLIFPIHICLSSNLPKF